MKPVASCSLKALLLLLLVAPLAKANDIWLSLNGTGTQSGLDASNTKTFASFGNFACSATPTGMQVGPGTVVHLTGTAAYNNYTFPMLIVPCSGTAGNPVIVQAENGFIAQSPVFGSLGNAAIITHGNSWVTLDGRNVGIVRNTNNGSAPLGFGNHADSHLIYAQGGTNVVVKQWIVQTACVHSFNVVGQCDASTTGAGAPAGGSTGACILNDGGSNFTATLNVLSDCDEAIGETAPNGTSTGNIYSFNTISHSNWGIGLGAAGTGNHINGAKVFGNTMSDFVNWDEANSGGHHNGVILFVGQGSGSIDNVKVYNNRFNGDFGLRQTGGVFTDPNLQVGPVSNTMAFNNLFVTTGHVPSNAFFTGFNSSSKAINNTVIGAGINGASQGCGSTNFGNTGMVFENNICYRTVTGTFMNSGATIAVSDYNDYFQMSDPTTAMYDGTNRYATVAAWVAHWAGSTNFDQHSIITDPNLDPVTFVPNAGSPVLNAGVNLTSLNIPELNTDRNGNARPATGPWTIGAIQAAGGGGGGTPVVSITPSPVAFGNQTQNTSSAAATVTVTNSGTANLVLSASFLTFSGANSLDWTRSGGTCANNATIAAGANCTVLVVFRPVTVGAETGTLTINGNASGSVSLTGTGTAAGTTSMSLTPSSFNYGTVPQGTTSAVQVFVLTNTGTLNVTLATPVTSFSGPNAGDFATTAGTNVCGSGQVLTPGQTCNKPVTATPSTAGAESATMTLSATTTTASAALSVTGQGLTSVLTVTPTPVMPFGAVVQGQTSGAVTATVTNRGSGNVTLAVPNNVISGTNAGDWTDTTTGTCTNGLVLVPAANCTIILNFHPVLAAAETATLTVNGSGGATSSTSMTGTGVAPSPVPAPIPWIFAMTCTTMSPTSVKCKMSLPAAAVSLPGLAKGPYVLTLPGGLEITVEVK